MSSRKYFNYRPYFTGALWIICGKDHTVPVDINVENRASSLGSEFMKVAIQYSCLPTLKDLRNKKMKKKFISIKEYV